MRSDLEVSKKSEADNAGLMVHSLSRTRPPAGARAVTDRNGDASTASSWNRHSRDTNANDALLGHEARSGRRHGPAGIWFSLGENGSSAPVDDSLAALPCSAYTMTELRCEASEASAHHESFGSSATRRWPSRVDGPRRPGGPAHLHHRKGRRGRRQGRLGRRRGQVVDEVAYEA
ncbi:MAG: hypothetical protein ACLU0O_06310 [Collinsella sp.]